MPPALWRWHVSGSLPLAGAAEAAEAPVGRTSTVPSYLMPFPSPRARLQKILQELKKHCFCNCGVKTGQGDDSMFSLHEGGKGAQLGEGISASPCLFWGWSGAWYWPLADCVWGAALPLQRSQSDATQSDHSVKWISFPFLPLPPTFPLPSVGCHSQVLDCKLLRAGNRLTLRHLYSAMYANATKLLNILSNLCNLNPHNGQK